MLVWIDGRLLSCSTRGSEARRVQFGPARPCPLCTGTANTHWWRGGAVCRSAPHCTMLIVPALFDSCCGWTDPYPVSFGWGHGRLMFWMELGWVPWVCIGSIPPSHPCLVGTLGLACPGSIANVVAGMFRERVPNTQLFSTRHNCCDRGVCACVRWSSSSSLDG